MSDESQRSCAKSTINHEMDLHAKMEKHVSDDKVGAEGLEHLLSPSCASHESNQSVCAVQVLKFKADLLEAVEELRNHREAQNEFEEQINQLLTEKQELEWQKESLQHQADTLANYHTESVGALKKKFQARISGLEAEKGKYQVTAELKDKEIRSLKEELKLLKLSKSSLQKTLSEMEQKLHLPMQSKDGHLRQLREVEKQFKLVTQQCNAVKEAHEKLEQDVGEALKINKNLSAVNKKQEATIKSLKQDMEKLNCEFVKFKIMSVSKSGEERSSLKEQQKQLLPKLHMQEEMNKILSEEISAIRTEKQEVMNSFQQAQRLLQMQTKTVSRLELEVTKQREEYQTLKREHELLQARTRETKDSFASLMEEENSEAQQQEESNLKETIQDYMSYNRDTSGDIECAAQKREREYVHCQSNEEPVQPFCPASAKESPSDYDDEGRNSGPTRLGKTVSDAPPQADYCAVIKAQGASVYASGHADIEGTGRGCGSAELACTALQPPKSPAGLAGLPAGGALSADAADALSVCGVSTGQQAPESQGLQFCMGKSHSGQNTLNEGYVFSSSPCHKGDFISKLSDCSTQTADDGDQIQEGRNQEQAKCIPDKNVCSDSNQKSTQAVGLGIIEAAIIKRDPSEILGESLASSDPWPTSELNRHHHHHHGATSEENNSMADNCADDSATSHNSSDNESQTKQSDRSIDLQLGMRHGDAITEAQGSQSNLVTKNHASLIVMAENGHQCASTSSTDTHITSGACFTEVSVSQRMDDTPESMLDNVSCTESKSGQKLKYQDTSISNLKQTHHTEYPTFRHPNAKKLYETQITSVSSEHLKDGITHNSTETDCSFFPRNTRFMSSFDLGLPVKWKRPQLDRKCRGFMTPLQGNQSRHETNFSSAPLVASVFAEKRGFLLRGEGTPLPTAVSEPVLQDDKLNRKDSPTIKRTADMLNTSRIHPHHKRDMQEEWNAITQAFSEISAEHETRTLISCCANISKTSTHTSAVISSPPDNSFFNISNCITDSSITKPGLSSVSDCMENKS